VLDEDGRRHGFLLENAEREGNQLVAITLREVGDRADQARVWAAQFLARFADGVSVR